MIKNTFRIFIFMSIVAIAPRVTASELVWVYANGESCAVACLQQNKKAYFTGRYKYNRNPFYICRTNVKGEGFRPSFNLQPDWSNGCFVNIGGSKGGAYPSYDCLCF